MRKRLGSISHAAVSEAFFFAFMDFSVALLEDTAPDWGTRIGTELKVSLHTGSEEAFHTVLNAAHKAHQPDDWFDDP